MKLSFKSRWVRDTAVGTKKSTKTANIIGFRASLIQLSARNRYLVGLWEVN